MLPFLKRREEGGASAPVDAQVRKPDDPADSYDPLLSAADDLKQALDEGNTKAIAEALRAAFYLCEADHKESEPK